MAFVPVSNTCVAELRMQQYSNRLCNTLAFHKYGDIEDGDLQDIAELVANFWYTYLRPQQNNSVTLRETYVRDLTSENAGAYASGLWSGTAGSRSGTGAPGNVTWAVSFRTSGRGRSYRGRNYVCGLRIDDVTNNVVSSTIIANYIAAYQRLLPGGASDPTPFRWVVASRYHNGVPRTAGLSIPIVSVIASDTYSDSMRTRLTGRGL
jgi:hypothetical protein